MWFYEGTKSPIGHPTGASSRRGVSWTRETERTGKKREGVRKKVRTEEGRRDVDLTETKRMRRCRWQSEWVTHMS